MPINIPIFIKDVMLWHRQNHPFNCFYCGVVLSTWPGKPRPDSITIDHVIPMCHGGRNSQCNKVAACRHCNGSKGSLTVDEFRHKVRENIPRHQSGFFWAEHRYRLLNNWQKSKVRRLRGDRRD